MTLTTLGSLLCQSTLVCKRTFSTDRPVVLVAPVSVQDVQAVYEAFFVPDASKPIDSRYVIVFCICRLVFYLVCRLKQ